MRKCDAAGARLPADAYVFGDEVGRQAKSVRKEWERVRDKVGLQGFHLADLRHEAASRFEEFGVPTLYVSQFLGHANLSNNHTVSEQHPARPAIRGREARKGGAR